MSSSDLHDLLASGQAPLLLRPPRNATGSNSSSRYQRDANNEHTGANDGKASSVSTFQSLSKKWEEQKNGSTYDPTDFLNEMADILEKVSLMYLILDKNDGIEIELILLSHGNYTLKVILLVLHSRNMMFIYRRIRIHLKSDIHQE